MTLTVVSCPHCSHGVRLDTDRLPDQPARFACPSCKKKVAVDKRKLLAQQPTQEVPAAAPRQPAAAAPQADATPPQPAAPAPPAAEADPPDLPAGPVIVASSAPADRRFPKLPDEATFPSGIILGEDDDAIGEVQQTLAALGSEIERVSSADAARQMIINEQPDLCIYVGGQVLDPPYAAMEPLAGLPSSLRRKLYLILIADNLKTLDGNSAFLYEVNMVLTKQDFPQLGAAIYSGIDYHERLYRSYLQAVENSGSI